MGAKHCSRAWYLKEIPGVRWGSSPDHQNVYLVDVKSMMYDVWCTMYERDQSRLHTSQAYIVLMCVRAQLQLNLANWLYLENRPLSPSDEQAYAWASALLPRSQLPDQQELTNWHNYQAGNPQTAKFTANHSPNTNSRLIAARDRDHGYMSFSQQQLACVSP